MRRIWVAAALAWVVLAAEAHADMVYLKDGRTVWGKEAYEEGDSVVVIRPGEDLRFPKAQVDRIERTRSSLPPYYSPPSGQPAGAPGVGPGAPGAPAAPGAASPPAGGGAPPAGGPGGTPATPQPSAGAGATQLPPPPPPPAPQ